MMYNQLHKPCLERWASGSFSITTGDVLKSSCSLRIMDVLCFIYQIWYAKHVTCTYCTLGNCGYLEAPPCCQTCQKKSLSSGFMAGLSSGYFSFPSLTSIWCQLTWELWLWRHSAGACLSASLDKSRQVAIRPTCQPVRWWHDGTAHMSSSQSLPNVTYFRLPCWKGQSRYKWPVDILLTHGFMFNL